MNQAEIERKLVDLGHRVDRVEQILPTLLTRDEFKIAMDKVHLAMEGFAAEIGRHFDTVAESLRGDIRLLAEGHTFLVGRLDGVDQRLDRIDQRLDRVELRLDRVEVRLDAIERHQRPH